MPAIQTRHIRVREGRLDLEVAIALSQLHVSEACARRICALLPNLPHHLCVNKSAEGPYFGDEVVGTELAHLLEHVIIELQGQAYCGANPMPQFIGHTSWLDELSATRAHGIALMRTTVTFADDLVALQAVKEAAALVEWAVREDGVVAPDVQACVSRIRAIM